MRDIKEQEVRRGQRAQDLLTDEVLGLAFKACEDKYRREWLSTDDERRQYAAWAKTHALEEVRQELHRIVNRGEYAQTSLQSQQ